MPLARLCPRLRKSEFIQHKLLDGRAHLLCTDFCGHSPHASSHTRKRNGHDVLRDFLARMLTDRELTMLDQKEYCSDCKVRIRRLCPQDHRYTHGRCSYKKGHTQLSGFNYFCGTYKQLSIVAFEDKPTKLVLDMPAEAL